jgi:hypothetical protein
LNMFSLDYPCSRHPTLREVNATKSGNFCLRVTGSVLRERDFYGKVKKDSFSPHFLSLHFHGQLFHFPTDILTLAHYVKL